MNIEQLEGTLHAFEGKHVQVVSPIRGTIFISFFGELVIKNEWSDESRNSTFIYSILHWPDCSITFQSKDVERVIPNIDPTNSIEATIKLKTDEPVWDYK